MTCNEPTPNATNVADGSLATEGVEGSGAWRPIAMGDVRLVLGEGRLNAAEVLRAVNVILARRTQRASTDGAFYKGVRASITWLHEEARSMNDPHAQQVLNNAAFSLGVSKPDPNASTASPAEQSARPRETDWKARAERAEPSLRVEDAQEPAWKRINALFAKHGLPEPPTRLRDELVAHLCAYEGRPL